MGIYLPTIDGDVIMKWDKESVTEMRKMVKRSRIDYEQLIYLFIEINYVTIIYLSFDNKTLP